MRDRDIERGGRLLFQSKRCMAYDGIIGLYWNSNSRPRNHPKLVGGIRPDSSDYLILIASPRLEPDTTHQLSRPRRRAWPPPLTAQGLAPRAHRSTLSHRLCATTLTFLLFQTTSTLAWPPFLPTPVQLPVFQLLAPTWTSFQPQIRIASGASQAAPILVHGSRTPSQPLTRGQSVRNGGSWFSKYTNSSIWPLFHPLSSHAILGMATRLLPISIIPPPRSSGAHSNAPYSPYSY